MQHNFLIKSIVSDDTSEQYVGCYVDKKTRDLPFGIGSSNRMTVDLCLGLCRKSNYTYAGAQVRILHDTLRICEGS